MLKSCFVLDYSLLSPVILAQMRTMRYREMRQFLAAILALYRELPLRVLIINVAAVGIL